VFLEPASGEIDQFYQQGWADAARGVDPLLIELIDPHVQVLVRTGAECPAVAAHRDVADVDTKQVSGNVMYGPAGTAGRELPLRR